MNGIHRWLCKSNSWKTALERTLLPWALEGIELGDSLLEVGPGPGLTTDLLRQRVPHLTALEIDPTLADALRRRLEGTNVEVKQGDATDMPFDNESFSTALSLTMLHHVPSAARQDRLLMEAHRVLRPNGVFAGIDSTWSLRFHLIHLADTMVLVDPSTFGARLEAAGFRNIRVDRSGRRFRFRAVRSG